MGLIFKGNPPSFSGNIKTEVPTSTYSGKKTTNPNDSINPYTNQGPGVAGAGLTDVEIIVIQQTTTSGSVSTPTPTPTPTPAPAGPGSSIFSFTGIDQTWTRPSGVTTIIVKIWAAAASGSNWSTQPGGAGGYTTGTIDVTNHATMTIKVGGGGQSLPQTGLQGGGWQDGGPGQNSNYPVWGNNGGGAGGRSAIRDAANAVEIISAGGGGGGGALEAGFAGNDFAGGTGLSFQGGAGLDDSGGGGGGFIGGLGGGLNAGGRGGKGYIGHADVSLATIQIGLGYSRVAPQSNDADYVLGVAVGANDANSSGGNGLIVISWL